MKKKCLLSLVILISLASNGLTQTRKHILYKQIDSTALYIDVFYPKNIQPNSTYPTIIFFFGGGWSGGTVKQFEPYANYFANRGMVGVVADYRVQRRHHTTPFESLMDAKSAIRYLRSHAKELGINPDSIVASGGSAGGHLAAATALCTAFNDKMDNLSVSCIPNALVLFNPVIDNGPGGYGYDRVSEKYKDFSPINNIKKGAPPTVLFLGTKDRLIPVETMQKYKNLMEGVSSRCELHLYDGAGHGFFNSGDYHNKTLFVADQFLESLGYIKGKPLIEMK